MVFLMRKIGPQVGGNRITVHKIGLLCVLCGLLFVLAPSIMDSKSKHLEFIQTAINRMAGNSFLLKGWAVTLVGGLLALSFKETDKAYIGISIAILFFFWILDAYYLSLERSFVGLYDRVRTISGDFPWMLDHSAPEDRGQPLPFRRRLSCFTEGCLLSNFLFYLLLFQKIMAKRRTFYSFHYERDAMRAAQVRNYNTIADEDEIGVIDAAKWEEIKRAGDGAIKNWIQSQLESTSVTAVLIGAETADREWVRYEIVESWNRGNAVVGIRIHNVKDPRVGVDIAGRNPFEGLMLADGTPLSNCCRVYDWVEDDGRANMGRWADAAADERGSLSVHGKLPDFLPSSSKNTDKDADLSPVPVSYSTRPIVIQNPPGQWSS